jgi:hypothetical protein
MGVDVTSVKLKSTGGGNAPLVEVENSVNKFQAILSGNVVPDGESKY